jgi:predicted dehydrogenase
LYWLLGEVDTIASFYDQSGSLGIETEDVAEVLLKFKNGAIASIHLDYYQPKLVRNCTITGTSGTIIWNLAASSVSWINTQKKRFEYSYTGFERNDRFKAILHAFLYNNEDERLTSLNEGVYSLKMVLASKYSNDKQVFVKMDQFFA